MIIESIERMVRARAKEKPRGPPSQAFIPIPIPASAGIKWASSFTKKPEIGLPYISGLLIFNKD